MDELILQMEDKIRLLIQKIEHLSQLNAKLKQSKALLEQEKDLILTKHLEAIAQIENMVTRLKSLETLS